MFTRGAILSPGELSLTTIFPSKKIHNKASSQQVRFVMIRIEFIFSHFKSIPLGASGEGFRKQTKEGKSLFTLRGLVSCDANKTSSELPLEIHPCQDSHLTKNMFILVSHLWNRGPLKVLNHIESIITANIFESGQMPTPWKSLDRMPLLPSCKLGQN